MNALEKTKEEYLSDLAHELRNPLASIMSSVELMQALGQTSEEIPHLLGIVDEKVMTMATVLDSFLDVASASEDAPIRDHSPGSAQTPGGGLRVLVVDDNTTAADSLSQLLMMRGYDVQTAYGGMEGFEKALVFLPQVAILDIGMPDIDGYKLSEMMHKKKMSCTYIALTGYGQDGDKQKASKAGFDLHLTKPARIKEVDTILQRVASKLPKSV